MLSPAKFGFFISDALHRAALVLIVTTESTEKIRQKTKLCAGGVQATEPIQIHCEPQRIIERFREDVRSPEGSFAVDVVAVLVGTKR